MNAGLRHRILTSVCAGALAGVLGASGMAAFAAGGSEVRSDVVEGACGTAMNASDGTAARSDKAWEAERDRWNGLAMAQAPWVPLLKASAWYGHHRQQAE